MGKIKVLQTVKKKSQALTILAMAFGVMFLLIAPSRAATPSVSDLQKKQSEINKNITDNTKKVDEKKQQITDTNTEISNLDKDIGEIESKIGDTQGKINSTASEIKNKESEIDNKNKELLIQEENQRETVRTIYESGQVDLLYLLVGSNSLSDVIDQSQYLETLEDRIESIMNDVTKLKQELEKQKSELENKKNDLNKLQEQQQAYKYGLDQSKSQKNKVLADAKSEKKSLEAQIAESKKLNSQVTAQINAIFASMKGSDRSVQARDRGTSSVGFQWPMDYKYITTYYGESTPFQSFHSGIDLTNVLGTPVYAAADGTVITATDMMVDGSYYGYGKYIIIGHNARFSSLYGHLMGLAVSVGSEVKRGDIIGYEGSTGWSTGPHLHFEIRENGSTVNPMNYLP